MKVLRNAAATTMMAVWLSAHAMAFAAPTTASATTTATAHREVKLNYGVNEVKLANLSLRIVRGMVGNGTASSFDTFTVYLMPVTPGEPWLQVTTNSAKELGYNFRNYESGDANTQAVAFYVDANHLYAVQASKVGASADAQGSRKTPFDFEVVRFNENEDIPMFKSDSKRRSKGQYVDGTEAIAHEVFGH